MRKFIKRIRMALMLLKSDEAILITYDKADVRYFLNGESMVFMNVFMKLPSTVRKWMSDWHDRNSVDW